MSAMEPKMLQTPRLPWLFTGDWVATKSKLAGRVWSNFTSEGASALIARPSS